MNYKLVIAVACYLSAVIGIGTYLYERPTEGITFTFGYTLPLLAIVAIVVFFASRTSKWSASNRASAILICTAGLIVTTYANRVVDSYHLYSLQREIVPATDSAEALSILERSSNPMAALFANLIQNTNSGRTRITEIFYEIENDPLYANSLLPTTLKDPEQFEKSRQAVRKHIAGFDTLLARLDATVQAMEASIKSQLQATSISSGTKKVMLVNFEQGIAALRRDIGKRAQVDKQLLMAVERVHSFLVTHLLQYQVTDTQILFISNDDLQEYNRLMTEVQSGTNELEQIGAESAQIREEWDSMRWLK